MIKANFNAYASYVTDSLYQWDLNQVLSVSGLNLSVAPEVHFSNSNMENAIVKQATVINHIVSVQIPNSLLQDPLTIHAHIGIYDGKTFKVVEHIEIPVIPRKRPSDYRIENSDEEIYSFEALKNALANAITYTDANAIEARIDNIIAHNNDTESNTELIDTRVDTLGVTHGSAGSAIRKQVERLSGVVDSSKNYSVKKVTGGKMVPYCEYGDIAFNADTGEITYRNTTSRIRTEFLNLPVDTVISLSDYSDARFYIIKRKNDVYSLISWQTSDYTITEIADYSIILSNITETELDSESSLSSLLSVDIYGEYEPIFKDGNMGLAIGALRPIAIDIDGVETPSTIRRTSGYILASAGDIVTGSPGTISVFEWSIVDKSFITKTSGWTTSYTVRNDCYIRVMVNTSQSPGTVIVKRGKLIRDTKIDFTHIYDKTLHDANAYTDESKNQAIGLSNWRNNWFYDISHRGFMVEAPQSTVPAFVKAKLHGYNAVEGDIRITSDGHFVIHHDDGMPSDSTYLISEHTLEELRTNANMGSYNGSTQQILTFDEWIKLCKRLDMFVFIERKSETTEDQISELIAIVKKNGMRDRVAWMATASEGAIFRRYDNTCYLAVLSTDVDSVAPLAIEDKPERTFIYAMSTLITEELVTALENVNVGAVAWLVVYSWSMPDKTEDEIKTEIKRAIDCGIRGMCLDNWSVADILKEDYADYL